MGAFALFLGAPSAEVAARALVMAGPLNGNSMVLHFLDSMRTMERSPATIARRLACLKQVVRKARILGLSTWSIEIRGPKTRSYRDTRGPGVDVVVQLCEAARVEGEALGARDLALVRLLFDMGLRRGEVAALSLSDLEEGARPGLWVRGKGQLEAALLGLPGPTLAAVQGWLAWRGRNPGPLFHRLDREEPGGAPYEALTGRAVHMAVKRLGLAVGVRCWPHGLRHTAITRVLDMTNDMRAGQKFARHGSIATTQIYDDNRRDPAGHLAEDLAMDLDRHTRRPS